MTLLTMASLSSSTSLFSTVLNFSPRKTTGFSYCSSVSIPPITKKTLLSLSSSRNISVFAPIVLKKVLIAPVPKTLTAECHKGYKMKTHKDAAIMLSGDGILAVIEQGEEPIELLAEPYAINSFDINRQNPSDIVCSLEWESIAILECFL
ncbi:hypothetical protein P3S68_028792 [Capsicum galapagoense]